MTLSLLLSFLAICLRCVPVVLWSGVFPSRLVALPVRLAIGIGLSTLLPRAAVPAGNAELVLYLSTQAATGLALTLVVTCILGAARAAGTLIDSAIGGAWAEYGAGHGESDPGDLDSGSALAGSGAPFERLVGAVLAAGFCGGGGLMLLFTYLSSSFDLLAAGAWVPTAGTTEIARMFAAAALFAIPTLIALMAADLVLAFASRASRRPHSADHGAALNTALRPLLALVLLGAALPVIYSATLTRLAQALLTI